MKESAYLLNFGYQGIMSTIDALVTKMILLFMMLMLMLVLLMVFVYGKRLLISIMILKVWKKPATCYKMATETGGGILLLQKVFGMRGQGKLKEIVAMKKSIISFIS
jgi:glycine C-acetyltransferase